MSDTATNGSLDAFLLDGDAPRLGSAAPIVPAPALLDHEVRMPPPAADGMLPAPGVGAEPVLLGLGGPTLPTAAPKAPAGAPAADASDAGSAAAHPMAHLMPAKSQPNETSAWAAEIRAKKKAKARRTKIIAAVIALAITAAVGPPLGKWLVNAINESGSTKSDEPAPTTVPAATATTAPAATPVATTAPGGLLGLPGQAQDAVAGVNEVEINEVEITAAPVAPAPTAAPAAP